MHKLYISCTVNVYGISFCYDAGAKEPEIDTASNLTLEPDADVKMTDSELTVKLFRHLLHQHLVNIEAKVPTLEEVRCLIAVYFVDANDPWKIRAPKKAISRSGLDNYDFYCTDTSVSYI